MDRYKQVIVTLPDGQQVGVEIDGKQTAAMHREGRFAAWFPVPSTDVISKTIEQSLRPGEKVVSVQIPVDFFAKVVVSDTEEGVQARRIQRFVVMPKESFAGYFGAKAEAVCIDDKGWDTDDEDVEILRAAELYWEACNDGTWPIDRIDWEE